MYITKIHIKILVLFNISKKLREEYGFRMLLT